MSRAYAKRVVYQVRTCMGRGQLLYLPTAPPSITRVVMPPTEDSEFGVGRAVVSINDVDILRGGESELVGSPLTKGSQT